MTLSRTPTPDQLSTIPAVLAFVSHPLGRNGRTTCPIHHGDNTGSFSYIDYGFICHSCGAKGHVGDLKRLLNLPLRSGREKPPPRITPLYPDGYGIHGWGIDWLFGTLKAGIMAHLLHRGLDGAPLEWAHAFARHKVARGGRTSVVETRALLEATGVIRVTKQKGRWIPCGRRTRRHGDLVVVHPQRLLVLGAFARRWSQQLPLRPDGFRPQLPLTHLHAWILKTWRIARDGAKRSIPEPPDIDGVPIEFWAELLDLLTHSANYCKESEQQQELPSALLRRSYCVADFWQLESPPRRRIILRAAKTPIEGDWIPPPRPPFRVARRC